jgi:hypothetical protein
VGDDCNLPILRGRRKLGARRSITFLSICVAPKMCRHLISPCGRSSVSSFFLFLYKYTKDTRRKRDGRLYKLLVVWWRHKILAGTTIRSHTHPYLDRAACVRLSLRDSPTRFAAIVYANMQTDPSVCTIPPTPTCLPHILLLIYHC